MSAPLSSKPSPSKEQIDALFAAIYQNTQGWVARGLNKRISFPISRRLIRTAVTPNQITVVVFFIGLAGCFMLLSREWWVRVAGAGLLQANSILDGCDGEVAKIKGLSSRLGAWLDTIADDVLNNVMFICLFWSVFVQTHQVKILYLGIATSTASLAVSFFIYRYLIAHGTQNAAHFQLAWERPRVQSSQVDAQSSSWFEKIKPVLKRDFFILVVFVFIFLDLRVALVLLAAVSIWPAFFLYAASFLYNIIRLSPSQTKKNYEPLF